VSETYSLWDDLEKWVPESFRPDYWRTVAKIGKIDPQDDIVCLVTAMGVMTLILRQIPDLTKATREEWEKCATKIKDEIVTNEARALSLLAEKLDQWESVSTDLEILRKHFTSLVTRMERASQDVEHRIKPLEKVADRVEDVLRLLKLSVEEAEKARAANRIILMRWAYVNAALSVLLIIWTVLSIALR
jgi:hypothetical protein